MRKPIRPREPANLQRIYVTTPTEPTDEQVKELLALNKRMFSLMINTMETAIEKNRLLSKRLQDNDDPLVDYELDISVVFHHKHTKDILAIYESGAWVSPKETTLHLLSDFCFLFPMKFTKRSPIAEWMGRLLDSYDLHWYELLNIGEIELRVNTRYQYFEYVNDKSKQ